MGQQVGAPFRTLKKGPANKRLDLTVERMARMGRPPAGQPQS